MSPELDPTKLLHVTNRKAWRDWLKKHYQSEKEIWLVYYKKHTGHPRLAYNDAVEEALCFGWIDSIIKGLDADRFAQRFSVRHPKRPYSQANQERLRALAQHGKVMKEVLATLGFLTETAFEIPFEIPPDILKAVRANPQAWKNFQAFTPAYIRIRIAFIDGARRRPAEFSKRLNYFIRMTEKNKQFGFGGIEKHY